MKSLVIVTIDGPAHNDVEQTRKAMINSLTSIRDRTNNGSRIKISSCDADDVNQIYSMMGKIKWFTLGRVEETVKVTLPNGEKKKERSLFDKIMWGFE